MATDFIKLTKNHLAVANAASKGDARPVLSTVHVGDGRVVASDGHIMVAAEVDTPDGMEPFNVPSMTFKKAPKPTRAIPEVALSTDGTIAHEGSVVSNGIVAGTYPDADKFVLLSGEPIAKVAFGVGVLKTLLASIGDANTIWFYIQSSNSPVHFETDTPEHHYGAIMPVSSRWDDKKVHKVAE